VLKGLIRDPTNSKGASPTQLVLWELFVKLRLISTTFWLCGVFTGGGGGVIGKRPGQTGDLATLSRGKHNRQFPHPQSRTFQEKPFRLDTWGEKPSLAKPSRKRQQRRLQSWHPNCGRPGKLGLSTQLRLHRHIMSKQRRKGCYRGNVYPGQLKRKNTEEEIPS